MAYDPMMSAVVLFNPLGDTWSYRSGVWINLTPTLTIYPAARTAASMAYDPSLEGILLFGGWNVSSNMRFSDTWVFANATWQQLSLRSAPAARDSAGMAYDYADHEMVLFGGWDGGSEFGDTWTFASGHWTLRGENPAPIMRMAPSLSWDATDGADLLFGGYTFTTYSNLGDTWLFRGNAWYDLTSNLTVAPPPRQFGLMTFDWIDGYVLLFAGCEPRPSGHCFSANDTWTFSGNAWTNVTSTLSPSPPVNWGDDAMDYDATDGVVIQFGQVNYQIHNWTWSYGPPSTPNPPVAFYTLPTTCGSIALGTNSYTNGVRATLAIGNYALSSTPCPGFGPGGFTVMGEALYWSSNSTLRVFGPSVVYATFSPLPLTGVSITPASAVVPEGGQAPLWPPRVVPDVISPKGP